MAAHITAVPEVEVPAPFSCSVCWELFVKPRLCFPCRHSFCEPCLREVAYSREKNAGYCLCPYCRQEIHYTLHNKSLDAEILADSASLASAYAVRSEAYARTAALKAKPLPGLEALPNVRPSYRRINCVLSFVILILLWLSAKFTRAALLDWFLLRTLEAARREFLLLFFTMFLLFVSLGARYAVGLPTSEANAETQMVALLPPEMYCFLLIVMAVFSINDADGLRYAAYGTLFGPSRRSADDFTFFGVAASCACALVSLCLCTRSFWLAAPALFSRY